MMRGKCLIGILLVMTTLTAFLATGIYIQNTSIRTSLVANTALPVVASEVEVNVAIPVALYEGVQSTIEWAFSLYFPGGAMDVTVKGISFRLYAYYGNDARQTQLDEFGVSYSPYLTFEDTQDVIVQREAFIKPTGYGVDTTMVCYANVIAENSTAHVELVAPLLTFESVPVISQTMHPIVWISLSAVSWIASGVYLKLIQRAKAAD